MTKEQAKIVSDVLNRLPYLGEYSPAGHICLFCHEAWGKYGHQKDCELVKAIEIISEETVFGSEE